MNDAELYQKSNNLQKRDALECLQEYGRKLNWRSETSVVDIGCGDGSVTTGILKNFLPGCKKLVGCDISEGMVKFANNNYSSANTSFKVLDIEGDLPEQMRGEFQQAFSFYTLHWIKQQEIAFTNIYDLLQEGGECLLVFLGHMPLFDVYRILARTNRWNYWLNDVDKYVSPYHDCQDPEKEIRRMMCKIGFVNVDVQYKPKSFKYDSMEAVKKAVRAVNPFKIPEELYEEFLEDYVAVVRDMQLVDKINDKYGESIAIRTNYNLIIAYVHIMNNVKLYLQNNALQKHDARECLEMFANKIQWKSGAAAIDIGCGDGFVTTRILKSFLPQCKLLVGCDKNEDMVQYAKANYSSATSTFIVQDIDEDIPTKMREQFQYVFSFYVLHWTKKPENALKNIFNLLTEEGECLLLFLGKISFYTAYRNLAQDRKWSPWMKDVEKHISLLHDKKDPEKYIERIMYDIGFSYVDVIYKPKTYEYDSEESKLRALKAVVSLKIPEELSNDFVKEFSQEITRIDVEDRKAKKEAAKKTLFYNLIYVHAKK